MTNSQGEVIPTYQDWLTRFKDHTPHHDETDVEMALLRKHFSDEDTQVPREAYIKMCESFNDPRLHGVDLPDEFHEMASKEMKKLIDEYFEKVRPNTPHFRLQDFYTDMVSGTFHSWIEKEVHPEEYNMDLDSEDYTPEGMEDLESGN